MLKISNILTARKGIPLIFITTIKTQINNIKVYIRMQNKNILIF